MVFHCNCYDVRVSVHPNGVLKTTTRTDWFHSLVVVWAERHKSPAAPIFARSPAKKHASTSPVPLCLHPPGCRGSCGVRYCDHPAPWFPWLRSARFLLCGPEAWLQGTAHHHRGLLGAMLHLGETSTRPPLHPATAPCVYVQSHPICERPAARMPA
ncbi:hypothetical protein EXN66_Car013323 [Channa argus]|uniref:Uncharacterized protein n=1 Tax=Channa argus TaxID=215402 RepID=A0A6G1Q5K7_CHAAH|nr:hypothetical protein EXN66_Car013323 [Channa argus]